MKKNPPKMRKAKKDIEEYKRLRRNALAKLRRIEKNYGADIANRVRSEIHIPALEDFEYREQYNAWKEEMAHFKKSSRYKFKKNKWGYVTSLEKYNEALRANQLHISRVKQKIKKLQKLPYYPEPGEQLGTVKDLLLRYHKPSDRLGLNMPKGFDFNNFYHDEQLQHYIDKQKGKGTEEYFDARSEKMKQSFIKTLHNTFDSYADEAIRILETVPSDEYYQMVLQYGDAFDFKAKYDKKTKSYGNMDDLNRINQYLKLYEEGKLELDNDFKAFS